MAAGIPAVVSPPLLNLGTRSSSNKTTTSEGECKPQQSSVDYNVPRRRSEYAWTMLILQHTRKGEGRQALSVYKEMQKDGVEPTPYTFVAVLKACSCLKDLVTAKRIHEEVVRSGCESEAYVATVLVDVYAKCGSLVDARLAFEKMPCHNVVSWTAMILAYAQMNKSEEALELFDRMQQEGVVPNDRTYVAALKACASMAEPGGKNEGDGVAAESRCLETVTAIHADIVKWRFDKSVYVANMLVNAYAKCGNLDASRHVFENMPTRTVVSWNAMISNYAHMGRGEDALQLYARMQQEGPAPNDRTFVSALKACTALTESDQRNEDQGAAATKKCLETVRAIHADIRNRKFESDLFVGTMLVDAYVKCGSLEDAQHVFEGMSRRDVVSWTAMISGYAQMNRSEDALHLYDRMQQEGVVPNDRTCVSALKACTMMADSKDKDERRVTSAKEEGLKIVRAIHTQIVKNKFDANVFVGTMLVDAYAKCGSLQDAREVFENMPRRDVVSWNALISGYAQMDKSEEALQLYTLMEHDRVVPDSWTYVSTLKACSNLAESGKQNDGVAVKQRCLETVRAIHAAVVKAKFDSDVYVEAMLVDVYAKCGSLKDARHVFEKMRFRNVVAWTALILGYAQMNYGEEALELFSQMQQEGVTPDEQTYVGVLKACSSLAESVDKNEPTQRERYLETVRSIHTQIVERNLGAGVFVGTMLLDAYAKCKSLEDARQVFEEMPRRDVVSWTAMILGYAQMDKGEEALQLYSQMLREGVLPNNRTYVGALMACGSVAGLDKGKEIHAQILEAGLDYVDSFLMDSLIDMYAKCGDMLNAQQVFDMMPRRETVAWNALISGYAQQGESETVFRLFNRMSEEGVQPDSITFLAVLTACSHVGLVETAQKYFQSMSRDYSISPTVKHFTCLADLLGRSGQLDRVMELLKVMPFQPDSAMWECILGACRKWGSVELGRYAFESAIRLNEKDAAAYVTMSNIYAAANMHEEADKMQAVRVKSRVWKQPGWSWWTDLGGEAHVFAVGDQEHPRSPDIYAKLRDLLVKDGERTVCAHP